MSEIFIENKTIEEKMLTEENFEIREKDLKYIFCDGKNCSPSTCLRSSCLVFEYWSNK